MAENRRRSALFACYRLFLDSDSRKISYLVLISFCLARACASGLRNEWRGALVRWTAQRAVPARSVVGATFTGISC